MKQKFIKIITMRNLTRISLLVLLILFQNFYVFSNSSFPPYPEITFAVISDLHFYDPALGTEGKAFEEYTSNDRKLLKESVEILEEAITFITETDADFVLIPGDLTKDGEKSGHEKVAEYLQKISDSGKKVYVIPGNHDISNPSALRYMGDTKERVPNITPLEFSKIYTSFGYGEALSRDDHSLSYVVEPVDGLWILGLDACRYNDNPAEGHPVTGGKLSRETIQWLDEILQEGNRKQKAMIAFMHHGVLEHYEKQKKFYGEYVIDNYKKVSAMLADHGVKIVFTGHYHAQDITLKDFGEGSFISDVETGSLVTYPCPVRTVRLTRTQDMIIQSHFIENIPSVPDFKKYSREYVHSGISGIAANTLIDMKVESTEAWKLSGQVADAFVSHYSGDEVAPEKPLNMDGISFKGKFLIGFKKNLVKTLYHDLPPADNFLEMKLINPKP